MQRATERAYIAETKKLERMGFGSSVSCTRVATESRSSSELVTGLVYYADAHNDLQGLLVLFNYNSPTEQDCHGRVRR